MARLTFSNSAGGNSLASDRSEYTGTEIADHYAHLKRDSHTLHSEQIYASRISRAQRSHALERYIRDKPRLNLECGVDLFFEGDIVERYYFIVEGIVETSKRHPDGSEIVLEHLRAGAYIGDLVGHVTTHCCSARTLTRVELIAIDAAMLRAHLHQDGDVLIDVLALSARRTEALVAYANDLKMRPLQKRLAAYLLELARDQNSNAIRLPVAKKDLANWLGALPPALSRALNALARIGVKVEGRTISIADIELMRDYCDDY